MHNLKDKFTKILLIVKESLQYILDEHGNVPRRGVKPKFCDAEVIALSLLSECLMLESENYLFKLLHNNYRVDFPNLIERSVFNKRRRALYHLTERVRQNLVQKMVFGETTFVIDSMPIEICKFSRAKRARICKSDYETAPSYGFCAAQKTYYFGYKLHSVITPEGVITSFDLSKAHTADIHYLQDIREHYANCILLGDKAYLSDPWQQQLFEEHHLLLNCPKRINQKHFKKQPAVFRKVRKRIETVFSQFCDQFRIQKNYAKTFYGLATRILAKITGFTMLQFLNKFHFGNELNHVKHALI